MSSEATTCGAVSALLVAPLCSELETARVNESDLSAGVTVAAGSGVAAAAAINADLVAEDTRLAGLPSLTSTPETPRQGITAAVIGRAAA